MVQSGCEPRRSVRMRSCRGSERWRGTDAAGLHASQKRASVGLRDRHGNGGPVLPEAQARPKQVAGATLA